MMKYSSDAFSVTWNNTKKFQIDISKTVELVRVYTHRRTDWHGQIDSAPNADHMLMIL